MNDDSEYDYDYYDDNEYIHDYMKVAMIVQFDYLMSQVVAVEMFTIQKECR
jgi:hypothetical protein